MFDDFSLTLIFALFFLPLAGIGAVVYVLMDRKRSRETTKRRLIVEGLEDHDEIVDEVKQAQQEEALAEMAARKAAAFYASTDAASVVRLRLTLMRAGFLDPNAVGRYFLARFIGLVVGGIASAILAVMLGYSLFETKGVAFIGGGLFFGYMAPTIYLHNLVSKRTKEYRNGFPDFMDLMIVCIDAGLAIEASVDRVTKEIRTTYPALAANLTLVTLELRAGRSLDESLKALSERLGVDEVRAFATLIRQAKELGTSLSQTLKVFSDEMRHKRMTIAEEKAHALPAKMTIPVTTCILPTVLLIAIIPTIVRYMS